MRGLFNLESKTLLAIGLLLIGGQVTIFYFAQQGQTGLLLSAFLSLLTMLSLIAGPVVGLMSSLFFIFIMGTFLLLLFLRPATFIAPLTVTLQELLMFGFILLLMVLIAGVIHDRVVAQNRLNRKLQEEIRELVAVDTETGFDNRHRLEVELDVEMGRVNRYDGTFTLIVLQLEFLDDFRRLYGNKEYLHLLASIAYDMQLVVRSTDRKFRYANDRFALLLTHTDDAFIDIVCEKLRKALQDHQLLNEKYVTLSYRVAHEVYRKDKNMSSYQQLITQLESELLAREL